MIFRWNTANRVRIQKHHVSSSEAEDVVRLPEDEYPVRIQSGRFLVVGKTQKGRRLEVVFVIETADEVEYDELSLQEQVELLELGDVPVIYVIHAMDLGAKVRRSDSRRKRRKPQ